MSVVSFRVSYIFFGVRTLLPSMFHRFEPNLYFDDGFLVYVCIWDFWTTSNAISNEGWSSPHISDPTAHIWVFRFPLNSRFHWILSPSPPSELAHVCCVHHIEAPERHLMSCSSDRFNGSTGRIAAPGCLSLGRHAWRLFGCYWQVQAGSGMGAAATACQRLVLTTAVVQWSRGLHVIFILFEMPSTFGELL